MTSKQTPPTDKEKERLKHLAIVAAGGKILITKAQNLLSGKTILVERPANMSFEEYKLLRRKQTKAIRNALR